MSIHPYNISLSTYIKYIPEHDFFVCSANLQERHKLRLKWSESKLFLKVFSSSATKPKENKSTIRFLSNISSSIMHILKNREKTTPASRIAIWITKKLESLLYNWNVYFKRKNKYLIFVATLMNNIRCLVGQLRRHKLILIKQLCPNEWLLWLLIEAVGKLKWNARKFFWLFNLHVAVFSSGAVDGSSR